MIQRGWHGLVNILKALSDGWLHFSDPQISKDFKRFVIPMIIFQLFLFTALIVAVWVTSLFFGIQPSFSNFLAYFGWGGFFIPELSLNAPSHAFHLHTPFFSASFQVFIFSVTQTITFENAKIILRNRWLGSPSFREGVFLRTLERINPPAFSALMAQQSIPWYTQMLKVVPEFFLKIIAAIVFQFLFLLPFHAIFHFFFYFYVLHHRLLFSTKSSFLLSVLLAHSWTREISALGFGFYLLSFSLFKELISPYLVRGNLPPFSEWDETQKNSSSMSKIETKKKKAITPHLLLSSHWEILGLGALVFLVLSIPLFGWLCYGWAQASAAVLLSRILEEHGWQKNVEKETD